MHYKSIAKMEKKYYYFTKEVCIMIVNVTGIELIPGNGGRDCPGNGMTKN